MNIYFSEDLYGYSCNQKIYNYYLRGKKGLIEFNLETSYFKKMNLISSFQYSFDIFTAYRFEYLEGMDLKKSAELGNTNPLLLKKEYGRIPKISEEKIDMDYFQRKKAEGKEIIDLYLNLKFQGHSTYIDTGELDLDEDFSVLEKLGYNTKMPSDKEIEKELNRFNVTKVYNITLPFSDPNWLDDMPINISPSNFFKGIKNLLEANAQEILFPQPDYFNILKSIGIQGLNYNLNRTFSLNDLNILREKISTFKNNPLVNLVKKLFYSLVKTIEMRKKMSECNYCGTIIKYIKGKKYCSYKSEGRDCGKSARNKRAYLKKKNISNIPPTENHQESLF